MSQPHQKENDLKVAESLGRIEEKVDALVKMKDDVESLKKWRWITFGIVTAHASMTGVPSLKKLLEWFGGAGG